MKPARSSSGSHRGVWIAEFHGPDGELFVYSIDSRNHPVQLPVMIPHGADRIAYTDALWEELDVVDPCPTGLRTTPPRPTFITRSRVRARALGLRVI